MSWSLSVNKQACKHHFAIDAVRKGDQAQDRDTRHMKHMVKGWFHSCLASVPKSRRHVRRPPPSSVCRRVRRRESIESEGRGRTESSESFLRLIRLRVVAAAREYSFERLKTHLDDVTLASSTYSQQLSNDLLHQQLQYTFTMDEAQKRKNKGLGYRCAMLRAVFTHAMLWIRQYFIMSQRKRIWDATNRQTTTTV